MDDITQLAAEFLEDDVDDVFYSDGAGFETCKFCGTSYDTWSVDVTDYVPPVGDGCERCQPEMFDDL